MTDGSTEKEVPHWQGRRDVVLDDVMPLRKDKYPENHPCADESHVPVLEKQ